MLYIQEAIYPPSHYVSPIADTLRQTLATQSPSEERTVPTNTTVSEKYKPQSSLWQR